MTTDLEYPGAFISGLRSPFGARFSRTVAAMAAVLLAAPLAMAQLSLGTVNPLNGSGMPGTSEQLTFTATFPASPGTLPVLNVSMNTTWSYTS
jgi:hypothetical protein